MKPKFLKQLTYAAQMARLELEYETIPDATKTRLRAVLDLFAEYVDTLKPTVRAKWDKSNDASEHFYARTPLPDLGPGVWPCQDCVGKPTHCAWAPSDDEATRLPPQQQQPALKRQRTEFYPADADDDVLLQECTQTQ